MLDGTGSAVGVLGVALAALVAVAWSTRAPPPGRVPGREEYRRAWSALHAGIEPGGSRWVSGWLSLMYAIARPLATGGVHPDLVTALGLWWALATLVVANAGGRWPLLATGMLVAGGIADGLDGAVAVLTCRAGAWGGVLDSVVDRLGDLVLLVALALLGAGRPDVWLGAGVAGAGLFTLEYLRARAGQVGAELPVVTVGERATRLVLVGVTLWCAGLFPRLAGPVAVVGVWSVAIVSLVGVMQLLHHARRVLR